MKLVTYDVEHGNCHVLWVPNQSQDVMLFDAGSKSDFSPALHLLEKWNVNQLRWVHISHLDSDHLTDIPNVSKLCPLIGVTLDYPGVSRETVLLHHNSELPSQVEVFYEFAKRFTLPVPSLGHEGYDWGGVKFATFSNKEGDFYDINNLSDVVFIDYQGTTILLPGDLEKAGWLKLLENPDFVYWLERTDIFVASHHGRESGFCPEVFDPQIGKCSPILTIMSDKSTTETSVPEKYRNVTQGMWFNRSDGSRVLRRVLTTRNDGAVFIEVSPEGRLHIKYNYNYLNA